MADDPQTPPEEPQPPVEEEAKAPPSKTPKPARVTPETHITLLPEGGIDTIPLPDGVSPFQRRITYSGQNWEHVGFDPVRPNQTQGVWRYRQM